MSLSYQECLSLVREAHPDLYPVWYIEYKGQYLFNMLTRGIPKEQSVCNFYAVDPESGGLSGSIPVMAIYGNPEIAYKIAQPHIIDPLDQMPMVHETPYKGVFFNAIMSGGLTHYGIKGQKWGVRRFQEEDGTLTVEGKERYGSSFRERRLNEKADRADRALKYLTSDDVLDVDRSSTKKDRQDNRLYEDVAYTVLNPVNVVFLMKDATLGAYSAHKEKAYMNNRAKNSELDIKTGLYLKQEGQYNEKEDLAAVNPLFMDLNTNSKNNCMLCTTTYDIRQRGYDVTAQKDSVGYTFGDLKRWYPKAKVNAVDRRGEDGKGLSQKRYMEKTIKTLEKLGNGARGNLMVAFPHGGSHSVIFEVQNGSVVIKDGQTNKIYRNPEKFLKTAFVNSYVRLDNVKPNLDKIKQECVR